MVMDNGFDWISLSRELKSLAEAGLRYCESPYDRQRYERLLELAALPLQGAVPDFQWPHEFGYATPKVDVRAAVIDDAGRILLVQEASSGEWTLPGGWADLNVSPAENAVKEVFEEAGLVVEATKLIACWDKDHQGHPRQPEHVYKLVFLCRHLSGTPRGSHETIDAGFFAADEIPTLCPHRAARHYLDLAWKHHKDQALPTEYD
jgi:ADP-ribose pyrophosphatase YjhB (NUDIX family)